VSEDTQADVAKPWSITGANTFAMTELLNAAKQTASDYCRSLPA
jgi:hypothetical protein